ncbi:MAG: RluA family pseudouridine synthase, partial [Bacteroidota bacterium]
AAKTLFQIQKKYRDFTLVEADIKTGRTHQIRVHFSSIGFPLAVDPLYGRRASLVLSEIKKRNFRLGKNQEERPLLKRLSLHSASLKIKHPKSGEVLKVEAPYHKDFRAVLQQMDKWNSYD